MKFSIVLPVYNAERYIEQTIKSVLDQNFDDYELIIINDGSQDESDEICRSFANSNNHIVYKFIENQGVSYARNTGLRIAKGDYILFLDADDMLVENSLEKWNELINQKQTGYDIIFCNYIEAIEGKEAPKAFYFDVNFLENGDLDDCLQYIYGGTQMIGWSIWKQCYRNSIIQQNNIYFNEEMTMAEDGDWLLEVILHCQSFYATNNCLYKYRVFSGNSITGKKYDYNLFQNSTYFYTKWYKFFMNTYEGDSRINLMQRFAESFTNAASSLGSMNKEDYERSVRLLEEHKEILYNSKRKAHRVLLPVLKVLGTRAYVHTTWYARRLKDLFRGRSDTK